MPFWRLYYHLVWPTQHREPWIGPELEDRLYGYLVARAADSGVFVYAVNGWFDHVHMLVAIPPQLAVAKLVKQLKGASSRFLIPKPASQQGTPGSVVMARCRSASGSLASPSAMSSAKKSNMPSKQPIAGSNMSPKKMTDRLNQVLRQ